MLKVCVEYFVQLNQLHVCIYTLINKVWLISVICSF